LPDEEKHGLEEAEGKNLLRSLDGTQEIRNSYSPQQIRLIFFLPVAVTDITTSTVFPQMRQVLAMVFMPALAATSVFDFFFSAIGITPFK